MNLSLEFITTMKQTCSVDQGLGWIKVKRPIILGSSPAKVPYRSSPLGQHLELHFVFLQYIFRLLVCLAVNGLFSSEWFLLVTSVARDTSTSFVLYPLLRRFAIFFRCLMAKVFLAQKILQTDLTDETWWA